MAWVIFDRRLGQWVEGFDSQHGVVALTERGDLAHRFATTASAREWVRDHADCGYGLRAVDVEVWAGDAGTMASVRPTPSA